MVDETSFFFFHLFLSRINDALWMVRKKCSSNAIPSRRYIILNDNILIRNNSLFLRKLWIQTNVWASYPLFFSHIFSKGLSVSPDAYLRGTSYIREMPKNIPTFILQGGFSVTVEARTIFPRAFCSASSIQLSQPLFAVDLLQFLESSSLILKF